MLTAIVPSGFINRLPLAQRAEHPTLALEVALEVGNVDHLILDVEGLDLLRIHHTAQRSGHSRSQRRTSLPATLAFRDYSFTVEDIRSSTMISNGGECFGELAPEREEVVFARCRTSLARCGRTCAPAKTSGELGRLVEVCGELFGEKPLATLVWDRNRKNDARYFSVGHEYMLVAARSRDALESASVRFREPKEGLEWAKNIIAALKKKHGEDCDKITEEWLTAFDGILVSEPRRRLLRYNKVGKRGPFRDDKDISWPGGGGPRYEIKHPVTNRPVKIPSRGWMYPTAERFWEAYRDGDIIFGEDETTVPTGATYLFEDDSQVMPSVFYSYAQTATQEFEHVCGKKVFENPKSWRDILRLTRYLAPEKRATVLDFFAGSGTTMHAVAACNRLFGGERRCVLVEMGEYFDSILLKRTKRIMFTPDWKDTKPARRPNKDETTRTPRLVKVLRLESYEDALHNLATDSTLAASEEKAAAFKDALGAEIYRLRYLARLPLEASASMLQTNRLDHPFLYTLDVLTDDGSEQRTVDLVETFNWLLGLDVKRVRRWEHAKREYRIVEGRDRAGRRVLVVWRDTEGLDPKAERAFLEKKVEELTKDAAPFDTMLANGDCAVPGFASLDGLFKQLMEAV